MPRTRSKRGSLAKTLDFNESGDEHEFEFRGGRDQRNSTEFNGISEPVTTSCPSCNCNGTGNGTIGILSDCNCSSCSALNVSDSTELSDDFCHRDRPRFTWWYPGDSDNRPSEKDKPLSLVQILVLLLIIAFFVVFLILVKWLMIDGFGNLAFLWLNLEDLVPDYDTSLLFASYWLLGPVVVVLIALVIGCTCACLSWNITYYDSLKPGILPPTPLSPVKQRHQTRHMFHLGYILAIANGLAAFTLAWWWLYM